MPKSKSFFSLRHVRYPRAGGNAWLLDKIDLDIAAGSRTAIVGAEGCGKSTLIRLMAGLHRPVEGHVSLDGRELTAIPERERAGLVAVLFRDPEKQILSPLVWEEVAMTPEHLGLEDEALAMRVRESLALAGVPGELERADLPHLPASMRYRVGLAAVLAVRPRLLLIDEPGGPLSEEGEAELAALFRKLGEAWGLTVVVFTSRRPRAERFAEDLHWLQGGRLSAQQGEATTSSCGASCT